MNASAEVFDWLSVRPLQDNPGWLASVAQQTPETGEQWLERGRRIPGLENGLIHILTHDEDPVNRSAAALALGLIGGQPGADALIAGLASDVPMVAMEAAAALGRLGRAEALEPLCTALRKNADANVRANACTALGLLGGEMAHACLHEAVRDADTFVRSAAIAALRSLPGKPL